ncbi:MAG: hypothetical protein WBA13_01280 [Microcoleaceae cyanobacterium]
MNSISFKITNDLRDRLLAHKRADESDNQTARRLMLAGLELYESGEINDEPTIEEKSLENNLEGYTIPHDYMAAKTIPPHENNWDEIKRQTESYQT